MEIKSAKSALATHLGWDIADMKECEYKHGCYSKSVYVIGNDYYCATKNTSKLPKPHSHSHQEFDWKEVVDSFVNDFGWHIFKHII